MATQPMTKDDTAIALEDDLGNVVELEHVNVTVPDQILATWFYIVGLGFTRDPYMNVSPMNMWVNIGGQEFHLPTRGAQVIPGHIGLVVPDLEELKVRLKTVEPHLEGTKFSWSAKKNRVDATCPWGNKYRAYETAPEFGDIILGVPYVEFLVKPGTAKGIARFYEQVMQASPVTYKGGKEPIAKVAVGHCQELRFRETSDSIPAYDGHHIAVYVANISDSYKFFEERGLIMEGMRGHQYRFKEIIDPKSGEPLTTLEHEVRSLQHPMYGRPFVNRNPNQTQGGYRRGEDAFLTAV
jgi:hypothetical protein